MSMQRHSPYSSITPEDMGSSTPPHFFEETELSPMDAERKIFSGIHDISQSFLEVKFEHNGPDLKAFLNDLEKTILEYALVLTNFNQKRVAGILGVKKTSLNEKLKRYGIDAANMSIDRQSLQSLRELAHKMIRNEINIMIIRHEK